MDKKTPPPLPPYSPYQAPQHMEEYPHPQGELPMGQNVGMRLLLPVGRSGWAIAAGYLGLFIFPGPITLLCAFLGIREIRRSQKTAEPKHGWGRIITGLLGGGLGTLLWGFAIYGWMREK